MEVGWIGEVFVGVNGGWVNWGGICGVNGGWVNWGGICGGDWGLGELGRFLWG